MNRYDQIKSNLAKGWNTWNNRSVLSHVLLPEGLCVNLCFKQHNWIDEKYLKHSLIGRWEKGSEQIKPYIHTYDGSYTELEIKWEKVHAKIQSAHVDNEIVILVTPLNKFEEKAPTKLIVETGILWNQPKKDIKIYTTIGKEDEDPFVDCSTPYYSVFFKKSTGISSGKERTIEEIKNIIESKRENVLSKIKDKYHGHSEAYIAIQSVLAWNTIYDPKDKRVISTVGRLWNEEYGGYCLFGWDNFFLSYMLSLDNKDLAFANILEHLKSANEEGFISNDYRGNGTRSWDRSQPPVGSIMVKEIFYRHPEKWFLEMSYEPLLKWNEWYFENRMNNGLLSYGSHVAEKNYYNEPHIATLKTARYESGMDDSPMYADSVFNSEKNVLELQDVGLNSLYLADCEALIAIGDILGKDTSKIKFRHSEILRNFGQLWSNELQMYLNYDTSKKELSKRISPTMFYPLMVKALKDDKFDKIVEHFYNKDEFYGEWMLPSITRNDEAYSKESYWCGAIWPPLNFLVYYSFKQAGYDKAAKELSENSLKLFLKEWKRKNFVCENYSSISGTGDDLNISSDVFHSWGALMGFMELIESERN